MTSSLADAVPTGNGTATLQIEINNIRRHLLVEHGLDPSVPDNRIIGAAIGQADAADSVEFAVERLNRFLQDEGHAGIRIETIIEVEENDIPLYLKTTIYRIMQEALNNVAKHSKANRVCLQLQKTKTGIHLTIQDNGRGFNIRQTMGIKTSLRGFGLASMRERAELSGGRFDIQSKIGKGTTIRVVWAL